MKTKLNRPLTKAGTGAAGQLTPAKLAGMCLRSRLILKRLLNGAATRTELDSLIESSCSPTYVKLLRDRGAVIHTTLYYNCDSWGIEGYRGRYYLAWETRGVVSAALLVGGVK